MTSVKFLSKNESLYGFEIKGHSSNDCDDFEGKIVCSAVSSAAYMTANTITEIIGEKCDITVDDALMRIKVIAPSDKTIAVLEGLKLHLTELSKQYSKRIKITTEV
ncbi:MAG: ribosomal-processing cysteine protease Prp [Ruminococcaceae bacterium]|nr:ribosomal-processing cysteine protease Prp [Oscillospiraceae bacterium]